MTEGAWIGLGQVFKPCPKHDNYPDGGGRHVVCGTLCEYHPLNQSRQAVASPIYDPIQLQPYNEPYDPTEQLTLSLVFSHLLRSATGDGGKKRARGEKPPWWRDPVHEAAIWSHINKWKHGEKRDKDSNVHPLVHAAWRCLAIAYIETYGEVDPAVKLP